MHRRRPKSAISDKRRFAPVRYTEYGGYYADERVRMLNAVYLVDERPSRGPCRHGKPRRATTMRLAGASTSKATSARLRAYHSRCSMEARTACLASPEEDAFDAVLTHHAVGAHEALAFALGLADCVVTVGHESVSRGSQWVPVAAVRSKSWLAECPHRVIQNRASSTGRGASPAAIQRRTVDGLTPRARAMALVRGFPRSSSRVKSGGTPRGSRWSIGRYRAAARRAGVGSPGLNGIS